MFGKHLALLLVLSKIYLCRLSDSKTFKSLNDTIRHWSDKYHMWSNWNVSSQCPPYKSKHTPGFFLIKSCIHSFINVSKISKWMCACHRKIASVDTNLQMDALLLKRQEPRQMEHLPFTSWQCLLFPMWTFSSQFCLNIRAAFQFFL